MRTDDLDFDLPRDLIAVRPAEPRDAARLLVVHHDASVEHTRVSELPRLLAPGDRLIANATRVLPARFQGVTAETGGSVEGLWLRDLVRPDAAPPDTQSGDHQTMWVCLLKARRFRPGRRVALHAPSDDGTDHAPRTGIELELIEKVGADAGDEAGAWLVRVHARPGCGLPPGATTPEILERVGSTPLPPYIRSARKSLHVEPGDAFDRLAYQTVFASASPADGHPGTDPTAGSVAAPTAGLHFTPGLLDQLAELGVEQRRVTLHVGAGTFKPVEVERLEDHIMHAEWCSLAPAGPRVLQPPTGQSGPPGRRVAIGTTSARTLEAYAAWSAAHPGIDPPPWLHTDLMIAPGHQWRAVDALLTNFHLPRSTLLALVSAIIPGGLARLLEIYAEAVALEYRFFSYGDAMLVLPRPPA